MRKLRFILSAYLVYCFAISLSMLLPIPAAMGQVGEVVEETAPPEIEEAVAEEFEEDYYEEPVKYSWSNENKYYEEGVEKRNIDEGSWKKAIEGLDYSKTVKPKKKKETTTTPTDPPDFPNLFGDGVFFQWLFRGLLLIAGVVVIVLIVRSMIQMKPTPKDVVFQNQSIDKFDLEHIEENLHVAELDPLIQRAIAQENYPMAIRLYYLAILKKLSEQKLVVWKKDKTNRDYLRELGLSPLNQPFQESTRDFEWVWYGDGAVGKQEFLRMEGQFQKMLSLIPQNTRP